MQVACKLLLICSSPIAVATAHGFVPCPIHLLPLSALVGLCGALTDLLDEVITGVHHTFALIETARLLLLNT